MENVNIDDDYFVNPEGLKLFRIVYPPSKLPPKAVVFVCHGLFEHCQAAYYETIIKPLVDIGCMIITHDHQGHGRSEGKRGVIFDFESIVRDVLLDIDDIIKSKEINKKVPVFIYGHSMGGLIAVYASLRRKNLFRGMCLEAPLLVFPSQFGQMTVTCGRLLSRIFPGFPTQKLKYNDICRNQEYIKQLKHDKLRIHSCVPIKTALELFNAVDLVKVCLDDIRTPFIIGHGEADELCPIAGSRTLMEISRVTDKTLIEYPQAKHQLRMEIDNVNLEFQRKIVDWIDGKIKTIG